MTFKNVRLNYLKVMFDKEFYIYAGALKKSKKKSDHITSSKMESYDINLVFKLLSLYLERCLLIYS